MMNKMISNYMILQETLPQSLPVTLQQARDMELVLQSFTACEKGHNQQEIRNCPLQTIIILKRRILPILSTQEKVLGLEAC